MSGPARAGALIFAKDVARLADFYRQVLQMERLHAKPELLVLQSPDMQLVIHSIPAHIAQSFEITSPPQPRDETAIKLFFTVPSIEWARGVVAGLGGAVHDQAWQGKGFAACNAIDPEGNIFQIRESAAAAAV